MEEDNNKENKSRLKDATNRASELLSSMPQNLRDEACQKAFEQILNKEYDSKN
jgi:hypothetical protein